MVINYILYMHRRIIKGFLINFIYLVRINLYQSLKKNIMCLPILIGFILVNI